MKVEFSAFPKAFSGNVAVFVGADKQLVASAQAIDKELGGAIKRAIDASRFTGAKNQSLTLLAQSNIAGQGLREGRKFHFHSDSLVFIQFLAPATAGRKSPIACRLCQQYQYRPSRRE